MYAAHANDCTCMCNNIIKRISFRNEEDVCYDTPLKSMAEVGMPFCDLPDDAILSIVEHLDCETKGRFASTCKRFKRLMDEDYAWKKSSRLVLGSNMIFPAFANRCKPVLSYKDRCKISKKWLQGIGQRQDVVKFKRCMPWLHLERNYLFYSEGRNIVQLARGEDGNISRPFVIKKALPHKFDDISKFAVSEKEVVSVGRDGSLVRLQKNDLGIINYVKGHNSEILCVDSKRNIIITGSKDKTVKIWNANTNNTQFRAELQIKNKVLSTALTPSNSAFLVGVSGVENVPPIQLFDVETQVRITKFGGVHPNGSGILDICLDYGQTFLVAGYESIIQLYDIRAPQNRVCRWVEPFDNSMYRVRSDGNMTMISGAYRHGVFHFWDKRCASPKRVHFINGYNSPIYSLDFDAAHIYAAVERAVIEFTHMCC